MLSPHVEAAGNALATGNYIQNSQQGGTLAANIGPAALDRKAPAASADIELEDDSALSPAMGPVGNAADVASMPAQTGQITVYTVRAGDSLGKIAEMFGVSKATILASNNLSANSPIKPGTELVILPTTGKLHTVAKNETLGGIAKKYKVSIVDIELWNEIQPGDAIAPGDMLVIPDPDFTSVSSPATPSKNPSKVPAAPASSKRDLGSYFARPIAGGRFSRGLHGARMTGVDVAAPVGTPVYAAAAGTVIVASGSGLYNTGYGNYVVINHTNGTQTLYAHLSKVLVSAGQSVGQGDTIGLVGSTGRSTGSHLHFEVNGAKNPMTDPSFGL